MSRQLDILCLEPFYGGARRHMLETVIRCSRHRWTLLKLPPRRIERRLMAAAHWFSEQLLRHWSGKVDVLFTSEAMNLADLVRLVPDLARKPAVIYFHSNQLPRTEAQTEAPWELVNLGTAQAGTELWFNSMYHLQQFIGRATALIEKHPELSGRNPLPELLRKALIVPPPVDTSFIHEINPSTIERKKRTIFLDTRDADLAFLNAALSTVIRRGEKFQLLTTGPVVDLDASFPRRTLIEHDEMGQIYALYEAGIILSGKFECPFDHHAIRAMAAGCWPVLPKDGFYIDLLPKEMHRLGFYQGAAEDLAIQMLDVWDLPRPREYKDAMWDILHQYEPITACNTIDDRLQQLAGG